VNEVKDICERLLDTPAPPLRDGSEVLSAARRSRHRARLAVAGSGMAVLAAVAVGAVLVAPGAAGPTGPPGPPGPQVAGPSRDVAPPAGAEVDPPPVPQARASASHGRRMDRVLTEAVPAGYAITSETQVDGGTTVYPNDDTRPGRGMIIAAYGKVRVAAGGGEGQLLAGILADGRPPPTGDLCDPSVAATFREPADRCQVIEVGGVPVRVTTGNEAERGEVLVAVRFLRGGFLMVSSWQGVPEYEPETEFPPDADDIATTGGGTGHRPPLAAPVFTAPQLAELAADPDMLP
jgi:hypothetical protein